MSRILIIRKLIKISYYRISENFLRSIDLPRPIVEGGFGPSLPNIYPVENSQRVNRIVAYASRVQNALQRVCTRERTEYAWYVSSRKRRPLPSSCVQQLYRDFSFNRDTNLRRYERNENPSLVEIPLCFPFISNVNLKTFAKARLWQIIIVINFE